MVFQIFLGVAFCILVGRFFFIQILEGEEYGRESWKNRIRHIRLEPPRGLILDRSDSVLVDNHPSYSLYVIPRVVSESDSAFHILAGILELPVEKLKDVYRKRRLGPFKKVKLAKSVDFSKIALIEERKLDLPGVIYDIEPRRFYRDKAIAAHLLGYLGEITETEIGQKEESAYLRGDIIGKVGVEKFYEDTLRGEKGDQFVEVDALGREVRELKSVGERLPRPGYNIALTLDGQVQRFIEQEMGERNGGVVVLNCRNGEVLAMVSKPDYDPAIFTKSIPTKVWNELNDPARNALFDRVLRGNYPPGSPYKLITAIAGLETGTLNPKQTVFCQGGLQLGKRLFRCWKAGGHGSVNLRQAIEQSCNVYFFRAIQKVGLENWVHYSRMFKFGEQTNIDLPNEAKGLVPDLAYFDRTYGKGQWSQGLLWNISIGQGDLLATPLQTAFFAMSLANRGLAFRPHILKEVYAPGEQRSSIATVWADTVKIGIFKKKTWDLVLGGMRDVVHGVNGTAKSANPRRIFVAGKTGTAQAPQGENHAWFIGFAPFENPIVAFSIFLEHGGGGGAEAAPIAGRILKFLLDSGKITPFE